MASELRQKLPRTLPLTLIIHRTPFIHIDGATPAAAKVSLLKMFAKLEQGPIQDLSLSSKQFEILL
jgi:hypothetical protein